MSSNSNSNQSSLAKFAFNIYGTLNHSNSYESSTSPASSYNSNKSKVTENYEYRANKLAYNCEREVITLSQLNFPLYNLSNVYPSDHSISHHVVVGGRNYLRILALNDDQSRILQDINVLEQGSSQFNSRLPAINKLNNINTVKTHNDTIVSGLSNGLINVFKISPNGKSRLINKFSDHKRCINSLDFITTGSSFEPSNLFISGSQDGSIKLWDLRSSNPRPVITIMSSTHSDPVRSCQYSPHSTARNKMTILSAHDSGSLTKFELRSPSGNQLQNIISPERKWNLHTGPALSLHIHPEKEYVLTGGRDQKMCIWNYSDSNPSSNRVTPEHMISTYGPVMKVRWSQYPSLRNSDANLDSLQQSNEFNRLDDKLSYDEREALYSFPNASSRTNSLYHYDFACSYLNDDSTITVYNLNRKYIPKEVITSATNKPFQNFIWPNNSASARKLWTVTKSNVFATYDLDCQESSQDLEISRPLDELSTTSLTWNNGIGDFCFVNQDKYEYEMTDNESYASETEDSEDMAAIPLDRSNTNSVLEEEDYKYYDDFDRVIGSLPVPNPTFNSTNNSIASSSLEKPGLFRSNTQYSINFTKSPSPISRSTAGFNSLQEAATAPSLARPKLHRNASTTTQESNVSFGSTAHSNVPSANNKKRSSFLNHLSPYVVPVSLPVPSNDDSVFQALADNYLVSIPEGFNLVDVCFLNASIAATVHRFRECQVWRMLAVSLEDYFITHAQDEDQYGDSNQREFAENNNLVDEDYNKDAKSLSSDLGNFVGSYNSNSTSTTNYGGAGSQNGKEQSVDSLGKTVPTKSVEDLRALASKLSSASLMELMHKSRENSFTYASKSPEASNLFLRKDVANQDEKLESAIVDDEETEESSSNSLPKEITFTGGNNHGHSAPIAITAKEMTHNIANSESRYNRYSFTSQRRPTLTQSTHTSEDLDNENLNILNKAANSSPVSNAVFLQGSPNYFNQNHHSLQHHPYGSFSSRRNSAIQTIGFPRTRPSPGSQGTKDEAQKVALNQVQEEALSINPSEKATVKSELTRAFELSSTQSNTEILKPWKVQSLLKQALDYSSQQGDIVFCSTLALLFHDHYPDVISDDICLDLISLYIEILQRKRLFVNCANVFNSCPKSLIDRVKELTINDVDLRFYCCWCEKLLVNEQSKEKLKDKRDEFGFWYCDECSRKQSNCIYCEEPCKGLTVVVSLKCGHRGHFGCLKEWFIEEENIVCPGGCDYHIV